MPGGRPPIPDAVKRAVRQRCGFGCVLCGLPVYHFDHVKPFSEVLVHDQSNLVLLCPTHHQEKTSGLIDSASIRDAAAAPLNRQSDRGETTPNRMLASWKSPRFIVGGNTFVWPGPFKAIEVDGTTLLGFREEDGGLLLDLTLFDETGAEILLVRDGELILSTEAWDIEWHARTFCVRSAPRKISIEVEFSPPRQVTVRRGRVFHAGKVLEFSSAGISLGAEASRLHWNGCVFKCPVGISVDGSEVIVGGSEKPAGGAARGEAIRGTTSGDPVRMRPVDPNLGVPRSRALRRRQGRADGYT